MLTEEQKAKIVREESAKFLSEGFGQLDLSGSPGLQPLPREDDAEGWHVDFGQGNPLKAFIESPDAESLDRLAAETGDTELRTKLAAERAGNVAKEFVSRNAQYVQTPENFEAIVGYMLNKHMKQNLNIYEDADEGSLVLYEAGHWTVTNIELAFRALARAGHLEMPVGVAKALSESERLHVISLCKVNQLDDAIKQFLAYTFPNAESDWSDITEFLSDPRSLSARNAGVRFCWFHSRPGVQDSEHWRTFETKWFKPRPIRTVDDYDVAYAEFEKQYKNAVRNRLLFGNQPTERANESLDDLSDEQVDALYHKTAREHAKNTRRTPGILE